MRERDNHEVVMIYFSGAPSKSESESVSELGIASSDATVLEKRRSYQLIRLFGHQSPTLCLQVTSQDAVEKSKPIGASIDDQVPIIYDVGHVGPQCRWQFAKVSNLTGLKAHLVD